MSPLSGEPRQQILVLGKFHLQASFMGTGSLGEDVKDECRTIDNFDIQCVFQFPLLVGSKFVIEYQDIIIGGFLYRQKLLEFTPTNIVIM